MKKTSWLIFLWIGGGIFYLSSIPGLRVLPVLSYFYSLVRRFDNIFIVLSRGIASRLPVDFNQLNPVRTATSDFYLYASENPFIIEFLLRKAAHVFVFFFLTVALFILLHQYLSNKYIALGLSFFAGAAFAFLDEYRQGMVDGRVASLIDVGIDLIGVMLAVGLILFSFFILKKTSN